MHESPQPATARVALQLYTVREALAQDREGTFRRIRELGFSGIETAGFSGELPSAASADELSSYGFEVVSNYFVGESTRFPEHLDEQQAFGNDTVVLGLDASYFSDRSGVQRAIELANDLADQCSARSMRLGYHNHPWEVNRLEDGRIALDLFLAGLRADVFLQFDYYWAQVGGLSIDAARKLAEPRIERLHLKDGPLTESQVATVFGEGAFDLPAAVRAAPGAQWHIIAFDEFDGDFVEASGADLRYLVDNGLSIGAVSSTA
ncbi:MAG: xylose isomerase [Rhodoglobus sp.]|nr:xylose isomerase [Rhodoglobus sp.]